MSGERIELGITPQATAVEAMRQAAEHIDAAAATIQARDIRPSSSLTCLNSLESRVQNGGGTYLCLSCWNKSSSKINVKPRNKDIKVVCCEQEDAAETERRSSLWSRINPTEVCLWKVKPEKEIQMNVDGS